MEIRARGREKLRGELLRRARELSLSFPSVACKMATRVTGVGVFEDLMRDPHLRDLVGQSTESKGQNHAPNKPAAMVEDDTTASQHVQPPPAVASSRIDIKTFVSPSPAPETQASEARFGGTPSHPLEAAKEAVKSIRVQMSSLQAKVSSSKVSEQALERKLEFQRNQLSSLREEAAKGARAVTELEAALAKAREAAAASKESEQNCLQSMQATMRDLKSVQDERARSLSQYSAAANAQKHLEESYRYLEQMSGPAIATANATATQPTVVHNPLSAESPAPPSEDGPDSWPWDATATATATADLDPELSMPNPYTTETAPINGGGESGAVKVKGKQRRAPKGLSVEEKAKKEESEARMAAVQRSKREKEAILKARMVQKAKAAANVVKPASVVLKTSELLDLQRKNQERLAEVNKSLSSASQGPPPQRRPSEAKPAASSSSSGETPAKERVVRVPITPNPAPPAQAPRPVPAAGAGGGAEEGEVTRDDVRRELEEKMHAFMPQEHEFREASRGSVPERSRASPGRLCNRHCSRNCLKGCIAGFLLANDIPVKSQSGNVGLDELFQTVNKAMRKFHPDRNSRRRVGTYRSLYCEEVCKDLSLLQSLMETTNEVTFVLIFGNNDMPKMRVNMALTATVEQLKKRVVEDYDTLDLASLTLRVGGAVLKDARTLTSCGIKENCIVNVQCKNKSWTSF